ncbi:MAG TPA: hypothetical protein VGP63_08365 [Planctomycetaceae bacterium]|nr:hypothetical protein [Planctomycetaceae bacterium]
MDFQRAKTLAGKSPVPPKLSSLTPNGTHMSNNNFKPRKFEDFEIVDPEGLVVGHIRVKPSGVLWARANSKVWHGVGLKRFAQFMEARGRKQKK